MTLQEQLDDARAKYHQLVTGAATVSIQKDGRSWTFQPADAAKLSAYIDTLEARLGQTSSRRGPPARVF